MITKKVLTVCLVLLSVLFVEASNTTFLVDVSGSMDGLSKDRTAKSLYKVENEFKMYIDNNINDTVKIITFTDRIIDSFQITPHSTDLESLVKKISHPQKGNTDLMIALEKIGNSTANRVVIISDGRQNVGDFINIIEKLKLDRAKKNRKQYFLMLEESDLGTPLINEFSKSDYITIIRSLTELTYKDLKAQNEVQDKNTIPASVVDAESNTTESLNSDEYKQNISLFKIVICIIISLIILTCAYLIIKLLVTILPLFKMDSAGAIQIGIAFLYNLPKPLFNLIFKALPPKMKTFLDKYMPKYDDLKRGEVVPKNDIQKQTLDDWEKKTGKRAKYKNGEIDFSDVAEYKEKLNGTLDDNIPKGSDPRTKVSKAQDRAAIQMLNRETGRKKIAEYVGKSPKEVTYNDYTSWKDDSLNNGKPNHNPKTPHESIDGTEIMWVPKKFHDVSWGGIDHNGGVSMLKSIRNYFGLNL